MQLHFGGDSHGSARDTRSHRRAMVERQLATRGIRDRRVLEAMASVPREEFVPARVRHRAYADSPLDIGEGQTISQPYIVAYMSEALQLDPNDRVLEIGAGSGYAAAVLATIASHVFTVERNPDLAARALATLKRIGFDNVRVIEGDGSLGWPADAPYDAIAVTAGSPDVPRALVDQLAVGGRLVIPVGTLVGQELLRIRRIGPEELQRERLLPVRFVPLRGEQGWTPTD